VESYITYLEEEVAPPSEANYSLHDDDEDEEYDWSPLQILSLESASTLIGDVIAAVRRPNPPLAPGPPWAMRAWDRMRPVLEPGDRLG